MLSRRAFASMGLGAGLMALFGLFGCGSEQLEASRISSVRYASGGGMEGGGSSIKLERQEDGRLDNA